MLPGDLHVRYLQKVVGVVDGCFCVTLRTPEAEPPAWDGPNNLERATAAQFLQYSSISELPVLSEGKRTSLLVRNHEKTPVFDTVKDSRLKERSRAQSGWRPRKRTLKDERSSPRRAPLAGKFMALSFVRFTLNQSLITTLHQVREGIEPSARGTCIFCDAATKSSSNHNSQMEFSALTAGYYTLGTEI